jgi:hypothetical protein
VSRSVSLPLDASVGAVGNVCFGERLLRAIQSSVVLSVIARLLAAGYLRSIDPIGIFAQRVFSTLGLRRAEHLAREFRVGWRQWFEDKVCVMAHDRTMEGVDVVLGFYRDMGYFLTSDLREKLYVRLMNALSGDGAFIAEMVELQKLPVGRLALQRRLLALDAGVEKHMAALAHEMVMTPIVLDGVESGGVQ